MHFQVSRVRDIFPWKFYCFFGLREIRENFNLIGWHFQLELTYWLKNPASRRQMLLLIMLDDYTLTINEHALSISRPVIGHPNLVSICICLRDDFTGEFNRSFWHLAQLCLKECWRCWWKHPASCCHQHPQCSYQLMIYNRRRTE